MKKNRFTGFAALLFIFSALLMSPQYGRAAVIYVGPSENYKTIQAGIDAAENGDSVIVKDGIYSGNNTVCKSVILKSENGRNNCIIDGEGNRRPGFIFTNSCDSSGSVIDGFTIRNCDSGIYCSLSSPTIINCTLSSNSGRNGGGMYFAKSSSTITNCTLSSNSARGNGGGIYCRDSSLTITNCTLNSNIAEDYGGGIYCRDSSPTITNCMLNSNVTTRGGGGISCEQSSPTITNSTFFYNRLSHSLGNGVSMIIVGRSSPTITNCTFYENRSMGSTEGSIFCKIDVHLTIVNSILWDRHPTQISLSDDSSADVSFSNVQSGYSGTGNINIEPSFVDGREGNLRLLAGSPGIDAGNNDVPNILSTDKDSNPRIVNGRVDMGAYEYQGPQTPLDPPSSGGTYPLPDIKANNSDGLVTIGPDEALTLRLELKSGAYDGVNADWWLVEVCPSGEIKHFDLDAACMREGLTWFYQGPIFTLEPSTLSTLGGLRFGKHTFYFGVDLDMNGELDSDSLFYDMVMVNIEQPNGLD